MPELRFAPSTLRNCVPTGAAHEAAAGHTSAVPSGNYMLQYYVPFTDYPQLLQQLRSSCKTLDTVENSNCLIISDKVY